MLDKLVYTMLHVLMKWAGRLNSWAWRKQASIVRDNNRKEEEAYLKELKKKL